MAVTIDTGKVQALVETALIAAIGAELSYVPMHRAPAEGLSAYCQVVAIDWTPSGRQATGDVDAHGFVLTAVVGVRRTAGGAHALAGALEVLRRALSDTTIDDSGTSGHVVRLDRASASPDPAPLEARDARTGVVTVGGTAQRASGTSRADFLT